MPFREKSAWISLLSMSDPPIVFNTNALLFLLVTAEVMRAGCQIIQYRRSA